MKLFRILVLVACTAVSSQAMAEKVAVLGIQQALLASNAASEFRGQLQNELAEDQRQLMDLEKQAKEAQAKLQANRDLVSPEQLKKMGTQFQKLLGEYQRQGKALQQKRLQREQEFVVQMKPKLDNILKELIESEGYDVIIAKDATLFAKKELDITAKVVELLNKQ